MKALAQPVSTPFMKPLKERVATLGVFLANGFGIGAWAVEVPRIKESLDRKSVV